MIATLQARTALRELQVAQAGAAAAMQAESLRLRSVPQSDLVARLHHTREAWRRSLARHGTGPGKAPRRRLPADALPALLACAGALAERQGLATLHGEVLGAAWALQAGAALALPRERDRHHALALAAVASAATGQPCHLLAPSDEDTALAAQAMAPLLRACGVTAARLAADTALADTARAYQAELVHVSLRRLAADLARERRSGPGAGPAGLPVTRGLHTAFIDDLDRLLVDDAVSPIVLSIADDATDLGAAVAAARDLADQWPAGAELDHDHGLQRLAEAADRLPPFWRRADRREALLRQALHVRDRLQPDVDYTLGGQGQLVLDEGLHERIAERDLLTGITQAVQARLGLPLSPLARSVDRISVQAFFAAYQQLAGVAPCLDGLDAELWRVYRLSVLHGPRALGASTLACRDTAEVAARLQQQVAQASASAPRLLVAHRLPDLAALRPLAQAPCVGLALDNQDLRGALHAQGLAAGASQDGLVASPTEGPLLTDAALTAHRCLHLVFTEPLESLRHERALALRAADACGTEVQTCTLAWPSARLLATHASLPAALARWLAPKLPEAARRFSLLALRLARWHAQRQARQRRLAIHQRERQLQQQLSFTRAALRPTPPRPSHRPHEIG